MIEIYWKGLSEAKLESSKKQVTEIEPEFQCQAFWWLDLFDFKVENWDQIKI